MALEKLYWIPQLGTGLWEIKAAWYDRDRNKKHIHITYTQYVKKYKDKHNENGEYVLKLAYNIDNNTVLIEIPKGKLVRG